jgi:hypothetical protein
MCLFENLIKNGKSSGNLFEILIYGLKEWWSGIK